MSGTPPTDSNLPKALPADGENSSSGPRSDETGWIEAFLETLLEGAALFDEKGRLLATNRRFPQTYGITADEACRLDIEGCCRLLYSAASESTRPSVAGAMKRLESEPSAAVELEVDIERPEPRNLSLRTTAVVGRDGQILGRVLFLRDVTETRAWEREIRELADLPDINPFPVFKCDAQGRVRYMNLAAGKFLLQLEIDREAAARIFPPDYREQIQQVLQNRAGVLGMLHEYGDRALSFTFGPDPKRPECVVIVEDVTEHRRADEKVRRYALELEVKNRELQEAQAVIVQSEKMASLGNLVAGIAHEINTPVGSVNSNSDVMVRALEKLRQILDACPPEIRDHHELRRTLDVLDDIGRVNRTASERIVPIVRSLRSFGRLDETERRKADLHEGLESTLTLVHHEIKNRIDVVRDYGNIPPIECFPNQLNQVFLNMLVNAAQAIEGKGTIRIVTRAGEGYVAVAFVDSGTGIKPERLPRIFEPGFTTKKAGSGLGLAICQKIVSEHGGRIDVQSEEGRGTTFTITLPVTGPPLPPTSQPKG